MSKYKLAGEVEAVLFDGDNAHAVVAFATVTGGANATAEISSGAPNVVRVNAAVVNPGDYVVVNGGSVTVVPGALFEALATEVKTKATKSDQES